jgi:hypothetical protein
MIETKTIQAKDLQPLDIIQDDQHVNGFAVVNTVTVVGNTVTVEAWGHCIDVEMVFNTTDAVVVDVEKYPL